MIQVLFGQTLRRFDEFNAFVAGGRTGVTPSPEVAPLAEDKALSQSTPDELLLPVSPVAAFTGAGLAN